MSHEHGHPPLEDGTAPEAPPLSPRAWMKEPNEVPSFLDKKENVDRLFYLFYSLALVLVVLDIVIHRHIYHPWEELVGFHAWYGFVGIVVLVLLSKVLRRVVMRPEDHYDVD